MSEHIQELEAQLLTVADGAGRVDALNELGWELRAAEPKRALALSEEAGQLSRELAYTRGLAYSLLTSGAGNIRLANNETALAHALEALALFTELGDRRGEANALNLIGNAYYLLGNFVQAASYYLKSLSSRQRIGDQRGEATTLMNIGNIYEKLGDYSKALDHYVQSLKIREMLGDEHGQASSRVSIGVVHQATGDLDKSLEAFMAGLKIFERLGDRVTAATCLNNIGVSYERLGDYDRALDYYLRANHLAEESDDRLNQATALSNMGEIHEHLGHAGEALACYRNGLTIAQEIGNLAIQATTLCALGKFFVQQGDTQAAIVELERGLIIGEQIDYREWVYKTHEALSEAYEKAGNPAKALEHHKAFHQVKEELFNQETDQRARTLMAQFQLERSQKEAEIYRLQNVELARAYEELQALNKSLQEANEQKSELLQLLEKQAREDALTGVFNRRVLDQQLAREFQRARRYGHELTVAIADIDFFKNINDRFSHQVGDEVLKAVAGVLQSSCRNTDLVARYGGEEFALCLPETSLANGAATCERIRQAVEAYQWETIQPGLKVTISIGVADTQGIADHEALLRTADIKLYEAKHSGRNRVRF